MEVKRKPRLLLLAVVVLVVVLGIAGCTGSVAGTVTSRTTGKPIPNARVGIGGHTAATSATGSFTLTDQPIGKAVLTVTKAGFSPLFRQIEVGRNPGTLHLVLEDGAISGRVLEQAQSPGILTAIGVRIGDSTATCDASGRFVMKGVAVGKADVSVVATGHESYKGSLDVKPGSNVCTFAPSLTPQEAYRRYYNAYRYIHYDLAYRYLHPDLKQKAPYNSIAKYGQAMNQGGPVLSIKMASSRTLRSWKCPVTKKTYRDVVEIDRTVEYSSGFGGVITDNASQHWVKLKGLWFILFTQ